MVIRHANPSDVSNVRPLGAELSGTSIRTLVKLVKFDLLQTFVKATTMRYSLLSLLILGSLVTATASADEAKVEAMQQYRQRIEGTWQVTALTISGKKAQDEDVKKITVVNADDGKWSVRSEGKEISKGTSTFDPTQKPKTIDFSPTEGGGKGDKFFGIYRLEKDTRKLCFAPAGKDRPAEFSSTPENQQILVTFERVKSK